MIQNEKRRKIDDASEFSCHSTTEQYPNEADANTKENFSSRWIHDSGTCPAYRVAGEKDTSGGAFCIVCNPSYVRIDIRRLVSEVTQC